MTRTVGIIKNQIEKRHRHTSGRTYVSGLGPWVKGFKKKNQVVPGSLKHPKPPAAVGAYCLPRKSNGGQSSRNDKKQRNGNVRLFVCEMAKGYNTSREKRMYYIPCTALL